ncbi:MAG: hypothetical protein AAFX54_03130 [Pseudomonadota bacterium]
MRIKTKILHFALPLAALAITAAPAHACYTLKFKNDSKMDVDVVWTAAGCLSLPAVPFVCAVKTVKSGETKSHNYDWGKTAPGITVDDDYSKTEGSSVLATYGYRGGGHGFAMGTYANSPPGCGHTYSIRFTDNDIPDDYSPDES